MNKLLLWFALVALVVGLAISAIFTISVHVGLSLNY